MSPTWIEKLTEPREVCAADMLGDAQIYTLRVQRLAVRKVGK